MSTADLQTARTICSMLGHLCYYTSPHQTIEEKTEYERSVRQVVFLLEEKPFEQLTDCLSQHPFDLSTVSCEDLHMLRYQVDKILSSARVYNVTH